MKKILVATDGSPSSREAVEFGLELAEEHAADVTFLHVVPVLDRSFADGIGVPAAVPHRIDEVDRRPISAREKLDAVAGFIIDSYRHDPELMKVIIVEVTRAANSFGRTHLPEISRAYEVIAKIVADGQKRGEFRRDVDPGFASMWFYGAIEQLLSAWVFDLIPHTDSDFTRARGMVVETICGGLEPRPG